MDQEHVHSERSIKHSGKEVELAPEYMTLEFRERSEVETNVRRLV